MVDKIEKKVVGYDREYHRKTDEELREAKRLFGKWWRLTEGQRIEAKLPLTMKGIGRKLRTETITLRAWAKRCEIEAAAFDIREYMGRRQEEVGDMLVELAKGGSIKAQELYWKIVGSLGKENDGADDNRAGAVNIKNAFMLTQNAGAGKRVGALPVGREVLYQPVLSDSGQGRDEDDTVSDVGVSGGGIRGDRREPDGSDTKGAAVRD